MESAKLNDWMQVFGIFALVASLVFVGLQMKQEQQIAIADTYSSPTESAGTLAGLIGQYPNVWRRGLDGDELSPDDELRFRAMAEAVETHFFNMMVRFLRLGINDPNIITQSYAYAVYSHAGLRATYETSGNYQASRIAAFSSESGIGAGGGAFRSRVDANLSMIDETAPPPPETKEYVFW